MIMMKCLFRFWLRVEWYQVTLNLPAGTYIISLWYCLAQCLSNSTHFQKIADYRGLKGSAHNSRLMLRRTN
jgi:hypothetical protein